MAHLPGAGSGSLDSIRHLPSEVVDKLSQEDRAQLADIMHSLYASRVGHVGGSKEIVFFWEASQATMQAVRRLGLDYNGVLTTGVFPSERLAKLRESPQAIAGTAQQHKNPSRTTAKTSADTEEQDLLIAWDGGASRFIN